MKTMYTLIAVLFFAASLLTPSLMAQNPCANALENGGFNENLDNWAINNGSAEIIPGGLDGTNCMILEGFVDNYAGLDNSLDGTSPNMRFSVFYKGSGGLLNDTVSFNIRISNSYSDYLYSHDSPKLVCSNEWQQYTVSAKEIAGFDYDSNIEVFVNGIAKEAPSKVLQGPLIDGVHLTLGNHVLYGDAKTGDFGSWDIVSSGGDGWLAMEDGYQTSYSDNSKEQIIDLLSIGYTAAELDLQPIISVSEEYIGFDGPQNGTGFEDTYHLEVKLLDENGNEIIQDLRTKTCSDVWQTEEILFQNYGTGLRQIYIKHGGSDEEFWAGHYGSIMNNMKVTLEPNPCLTNPMVITETVNNTSCVSTSDGSISLEVAGGASPYTYLWSNGATTATLSNLSNNLYTVTVTDATFCTAVKELYVNFNGQPFEINLLTKQDPFCLGQATGMIDISAQLIPSRPAGSSSSLPPYSFLWSNGATTEDLVNVVAGIYTVTVTDDESGCTEESSFELYDGMTVFYDFGKPGYEPSTVCFGESTGSILGTTFGGQAPYTYLWSNGAVSSSLENIPAGNYSLTVTDANGCSTEVNNLVVNEYDQLSMSLAKDDVSCHGGSDGYWGIASLNGGVEPYTYLWSNGVETPDNFDLQAGSYDLTVTDAVGCTSVILNSIINEPEAIEATHTGTTLTCFNSNDGSAVISPTGGTPPYTYFWEDESTGDTNNALAADIHFVTITDANGCSIIHEIEILGPEEIFIEDYNDPACFGESNGAIEIYHSGGTGSVSYNWSNGATSSFVNQLAPGFYSVTLVDVNGCTIEKTFEVLELEEIALEVSVLNANCFGSSDGSASLPEIAGWNYEWSTGATGLGINNLAADSYQVTITDVYSCTKVVEFQIGEPSLTVVFVDLISSPTCSNPLGGSASAYIDSNNSTGGSFIWSDGQTTETATALGAGTYTVTATDDFGCTSVETITLEQSDGPNLTANTITSPTCFEDLNGSIDVDVLGGTAPYTFLWSNGDITEDLLNINAGLYNLTVTDANGCQASLGETELGEPTLLEIDIFISEISCYNGSDGVLDLVFNGGVSPYTFVFSNGETFDGLQNNEALSFTALAAGTFSGTLTDANGCMTTMSTTFVNPLESEISLMVNNPLCNGETGTIVLEIFDFENPVFSWSDGSTNPILTAVAGVYDVTVSNAAGCEFLLENTEIFDPEILDFEITILQNPTCEDELGGAIELNISGGSLNYLVTDGLGSTNALSTETNYNISGYGLGSYLINIQDDNGCLVQKSIEFSIADGPQVTITNTINPSCFGFDDGSIDIEVSQGLAPYTFLWSNGSTSQNISNLANGNFTVTITDANGCEAIASASVQSNGLIEADFLFQDNYCPGGNMGEITTFTSGGAGDYTYAWSNGATTANISNLVAGFYDLTITDAAGCTLVYSGLDVFDQAGMLVNATILDQTCSGSQNGVINLTIENGMAPYFFQWSNGFQTQNATGLGQGVYSVTITDSAGCTVTANGYTITEPAGMEVGTNITAIPTCQNQFGGGAGAVVGGGQSPYTFAWSNGATGQNATGFAAGTHVVTVTDAIGCTETATVTLSQVDGPNVVLANSFNPNCPGQANGSLDISVSGGQAPYSFVWSNGMTTEDISNIIAGTYNVTVTDMNGCGAELGVINLTEPSEIVSTTISAFSPGCDRTDDGSIDISVSGGTSPYTYAWSNGAMDQDLTGLEGGSYLLTITDANGCMKMVGPFELNIADPIVLETSSTAESCGNTDGTASVQITGGTSPFSFSWSNGANTQNLTGVTSGLYTVLVTDANGCQKESEVLVNSTGGPLAMLDGFIPIECAGDASGGVQISVSDGAGNYTFQWSNGMTTEDISGLSAGIYSVTITDTNGCSFIAGPFDLEEPSPLTYVIMQSSESCKGGDGSASIDGSGGIPPYVFEWSNGATSQNITDLEAGEYAVTLTDALGCTVDGFTTVEGADAFVVVTEFIQEPNCFGENSGILNVLVSGDTEPVSFEWSNGSTTQNLENIGAGSYSVTATDANGCTGMFGPFILGQPEQIVANITSVNATCGEADGSATVEVTGAVGALTFEWSNGANGAEVSDLSTGEYSVVITDENGCSIEEAISISSFGGPSIELDEVRSISCNGGIDGEIFINVTDGAAPFSFEWSNGATSQNVSDLNAGTYIVTVTDVNGCVTVSDMLLVEEPEALVIVGESFDVSEMGENDGSVSIEISGGTPDYSIVWSTGLTVPEIIGLAPGTYSVTVTDKNGCQEMAEFVIEGGPNALADVDGLISFSSFPNPTTGLVHIKIDLEQAMDSNIEIYNAVGLLIDRISNLRASNIHQQIDLTKEPDGLYFVKLKLGKEIHVERIFKGQ